MLHEFLSERREELIERCRIKVSQRSAPKVTQVELEHGIPMFLDQLTKTLRVEQTADPMKSRKVSGPSGGGEPTLSEIGETAARHGSELLQRGFTVEQVVHDYGDLCQAITDLAFEVKEPIETDEFRTLNRCLDNGIATAVTEYNYRRDFLVAGRQSDLLNERLGSFAHELRNLLNTAMLALTVIKAGNVGVGGATGAILDRSLIGLRHLIDRSLNEVRSTAGVPLQHQLFSLWEFVDELRLSASLEANIKLCTLAVSDVESELALDADRDLLLSVVGNLLQNAFKFTAPGTEVSLRAYAVADRILIEVEDRCGELPSGFAEKMFQPFTQAGHDHSGLGLGLTIAKRSVEANDGTLSVRDIPNVGCIFTVNLPRHSMPEADRGPAQDPCGSDAFEIVVLSAQAKKVRVIVAEDGISNRKLLEYILERLGLFSTVMVKDGYLALALSATGAFDVILMDCHMPVMDGYEATRKIRLAEKAHPERKRIHIIGISAAALAHERSSAMDAGMDNYLTKPLQLSQLATALERVVAEA